VFGGCGTNLGNRCSEHNNFIQLANSLHELINTGALDDIDIVVVALDFDR